MEYNSQVLILQSACKRVTTKDTPELTHHWNRNYNLMKFSLLAALEVVSKTTSSAQVMKISSKRHFHLSHEGAIWQDCSEFKCDKNSTFIIAVLYEIINDIEVFYNKTPLYHQTECLKENIMKRRFWSFSFYIYSCCMMQPEGSSIVQSKPLGGNKLPVYSFLHWIIHKPLYCYSLMSVASMITKLQRLVIDSLAPGRFEWNLGWAIFSWFHLLMAEVLPSWYCHSTPMTISQHWFR